MLGCKAEENKILPYYFRDGKTRCDLPVVYDRRCDWPVVYHVGDDIILPGNSPPLTTHRKHIKRRLQKLKITEWGF